MTLKIATFSDLPDILSMAHKFAQASTYAGMTVDDGKVTKLIDMMLSEGPKVSIILLAIEDDKPVGMIGARATEPLYFKEKVAAELVWWVEPEHRRSNHAKELIDAYEYWAKNVSKCDYTQMSLLETDQINLIDRIYRRRGYRTTERSYVKEV